MWCSSRRPAAASRVLAAEIGLDHLRVGLHLRPARPRRSSGRSRARVTRVAHAHHHVHVVLDQDHRDAVVADLADDRDQLLDVGRGQAGGRLVEQQQLRVERQRAARSRAGAACRRAGCAPPRRRGAPRPTNSSSAMRARPRRRAPRAGSAACAASTSSRLLRKVWCRPTSTFCSAVISPNSCTFWKVRAMPDSAISRRACGRRSSGPSNAIAAGGRHVDAGQHVHHRALARAVRPDQAVDACRALTAQVDVVQRLQAAELHQHACAPAAASPPAAAARRVDDRVGRRAGSRRRLGAAASGRAQVQRVAHEADDAVLQVVDDEQRHQAEDRQAPVGHASAARTTAPASAMLPTTGIGHAARRARLPRATQPRRRRSATSTASADRRRSGTARCRPAAWAASR